MKYLKNGLVIYLALLFQASVIPALFPRWVVPDIVFCLSAVAAIVGGSVPGVIVGAVGGLMQDALTGSFVGANAGANMALAAAIGIIEPELFKESLLTPAAVVGMGGVVRELLYMFMIGSFGASVDIGRAVFVVLPWTTALNCCAGILVYRMYYLAPLERQRSSPAVWS